MRTKCALELVAQQFVIYILYYIASSEQVLQRLLINRRSSANVKFRLRLLDEDFYARIDTARDLTDNPNQQPQQLTLASLLSGWHAVGLYINAFDGRF
jgi:hypothetical protein